MNNQSGDDQEPRARPLKILFLGGLSGSGKSWFSGQWLVEKHGWLWFEIDLPLRDGVWRDGVEANGLRYAWDAFLANTRNHPHPRPLPLHEELSRRAGSFDRIVLSLSSCQVFEERHLQAAEGYFYFTYFYGNPARCRREFLDRERKAMIDAGKAELWTPDREREFSDSWSICNDVLPRKLEQPHNRELLIDPFTPDGLQRNPDEIYQQVLKLIRE